MSRNRKKKYDPQYKKGSVSLTQQKTPKCCGSCDNLGSWATADQGCINLGGWSETDKIYFEREVDVCKLNGLEVKNIEKRPTWCPVAQIRNCCKKRNSSDYY